MQQSNNSLPESGSLSPSPSISYQLVYPSPSYPNPTAPVNSPLYSTEMASMTHSNPSANQPVNSLQYPNIVNPGQSLGYSSQVNPSGSLTHAGQHMGYTPQVDVPLNLVHTGQPIVIPNVNVVQLTDEPQIVMCRHCNSVVVTEVRYKNGLANWLGCMIFTAWGCFNGLCLVPFCIQKLKDSYHYCSNCGQHLGTKPRIELS